MNPAEKSRRVAATYVESNFDRDDRLAVIVFDRHTGAVTQRLARAESIAGPDFQAWLRHKNAHRCDIYISMNALHPQARRREKQDVALVRHLYLDLDEGGAAAAQRLLNRTDVPRPNYVIESSPDKRQLIWRVESFDKDHAEELQRHLVQEFGGDPAATDCSRVMRLPGFYNHKYAQPHFVTVEQTATAVYRPEHFGAFVPTKEMPVSESPTKSRRSAHGGTLSQSERDWAYAKRALARGEKAEVVIAALETRRAGDKHNPRYYAEHTVKKAQDVLEQEKGSKAEDLPPR